MHRRHHQSLGSSKRKQHRGLYPLSLRAYRLWRQGKAHGNGMAGSHQGNGRRGKPNAPRRKRPQNSLQPLPELKTLTTQKLTIMKKNSIWELILKVIVAAITAALTAITTTSCMGRGPF
ncbi:MAG: smalltalk protein [Bacteroidaceae bacterium]|nr:smalltalk protein [Bacteroidaceae bacterium]